MINLLINSTLIYSVLITIILSYLSYKLLPYDSRILFLPFIYSAYSKFLSLFYISTNEIYLHELGIHSRIDYSYIEYGLISVIFFFIATFFYKLINTNYIYTHSNFFAEKSISLFITISILLILFANLFLSKTDLPINRHLFYIDQSFIPREYLFFGILIFFTIPISFLVFKSKRAIIFFIFLYFCYLFLSGQKFHGILTPFLIFMAFNRLKPVFNITNSKLIIFGFFTSLVVSIDISKRMIASNFDNFLEPIIYRIAVIQGGMTKYFYQTCDYFSCNHLSFFNTSEVLKENIMDYITFNSYQEVNVNVTTGLFHMLRLDYSSAIFVFVYCFFISFIIKNIIASFHNKLYLEIVILMYLYMFALVIFERAAIFDVLYKLLAFSFFYILIKLLRTTLKRSI